MRGCDPGRVSDGSRLALCQTLSIECPSSIFFWHVYFVILVPFSLSFCMFVFFVCSRWSFVDVPLTFFCPAAHVPDWQPRTLLDMVEARSVNVKKTTTTTPIFRINIYIYRLFKCFKTKIYAPRIRTKPCLVLLLYCSTIVLLPLLFENPLLILLPCLL